MEAKMGVAELVAAVGEAGVFLVKHEDIIKAIADAIEAGASQDAIVLAVRQVMIEASDARMRALLPPENPNV